MPRLERIKMMGFRCQRCGHAWVPHDPSKPPRTCPGCKSPFWDRQRERMQARAVKAHLDKAKPGQNNKGTAATVTADETTPANNSSEGS